MLDIRERTAFKIANQMRGKAERAGNDAALQLPGFQELRLVVIHADRVAQFNSVGHQQRAEQAGAGQVCGAHQLLLLVVPQVWAEQLPEEGADSPVDSAQKILRELQRYDESLYQKPRWLVLNKTDLLAEEEVQAICAEITRGLGWNGPVYSISAINGLGVELLCRDIMSLLETDESI